MVDGHVRTYVYLSDVEVGYYLFDVGGWDAVGRAVDDGVCGG